MNKLPKIILGIALVTCVGCGPGMNRISRVEEGLRTGWRGRSSTKMNIRDRMDFHQVPGVSIAMINDFRIEWTSEYGILENGAPDSITPETLFQSASIGKPVIACAALNLVEEGKLPLDEDVNQYLRSWTVPVNSFTDRSPVTLRRLLSHTAGVNLPGVIGYRSGEPLPDLGQILNGEPPANTPPIVVDQVPGTGYKYSSGGFMIVQQLLMDHSKQGISFPEIIADRVFNPAGMSMSTFDFDPGGPASSVASGHRSDGSPIIGKSYDYPEMGMGVFWTTPTDMAKFMLEIINAYKGNSSHILSEEMTRLMLTPQVAGQGLDFRLADDGKDRFYFYHRGAVEGFQTYIVGYPKRGQGAVIMTNSDSGYALIEEIMKSISIEYKWVGGLYF